MVVYQLVSRLQQIRLPAGNINDSPLRKGHGGVTLIGIVVYVKLRAKHPHHTMPGVHLKGHLLVTCHLEVGFTAHIDPAHTVRRRKNHGITQA